MVTTYQKTGSSQAREQKTAGVKNGAGKDDACRCKEASNMKPRQLLRLMISDLAFWKKAKKG